MKKWCNELFYFRSMQILLWPFAKLYGVIILLRNFLFDIGILKQKSFNFPIICIGNLKTGGTGKSPQVFYLAMLLRTSHRITILSRGYGRSTKGFRFVNPNDTAIEVGDEPLQYAKYLKDVTVAVSEKRKEGIESIIQKNGTPDLIILDDAFQHRYIKAGLNILLTEFNDLYIDDELLPLGRLREPISSSKRAQCIVVTKCPASISETEMASVKSRLNLNSFQKLFFTYIKYNELLTIDNSSNIILEELRDKNILLLTGIANPAPLKSFLIDYCLAIDELIFPDHHSYSVADIVHLRKKFDMFAMAFVNTPTYIVTTRKDAMRLQRPELKMLIKDLPIAIIDIEIAFVGNQSKEFNQLIQHYVESN